MYMRRNLNEFFNELKCVREVFAVCLTVDRAPYPESSARSTCALLSAHSAKGNEGHPIHVV